jgi:hypothetical protein
VVILPEAVGKVGMLVPMMKPVHVRQLPDVIEGPTYLLLHFLILIFGPRHGTGINLLLRLLRPIGRHVEQSSIGSTCL